jgi:phenylalanyl-tRNA synthetase beta chain
MGKVYGKTLKGKYYEAAQLAIYISGKQLEDGWRNKGIEQDFFVAKGIAQAIFNILGIEGGNWKTSKQGQIDFVYNKQTVGQLEVIGSSKLQAFGIKQSVVYINFDLATLFALYQSKKVTYKEVSKYPSIERDLALVVAQETTYEAIEACISAANIASLKDTRVFDIFESEKLGHQKKSVAINFVFNADDKTLTDTEIDAMMKKLIQLFEKNIQAEIRK